MKNIRACLDGKSILIFRTGKEQPKDIQNHDILEIGITYFKLRWELS